MATAGRKTKLSDELLGRICAGLRSGLSYKDVCGLCRISDETLRLWRAQKPEVRAAIEQAEAECVMDCLKAINGAARDGDWRAAAWVLERRFPDDFGRRERQKIEHSGVPGQPIQISIFRRSEALAEITREGDEQ
jgi:hypothetical protein